MFWAVDLLHVCVGSWVECTGGVSSVLGGMGGRSLLALGWTVQAEGVVFWVVDLLLVLALG